MKIERVDEKTVKCFLSNEELEEYEIDYKDFITRSEKARQVVQEILEQAAEQVGYKPPRFAFDMQIMMLPDQGLLLTFSESDPANLPNAKQLMEYLQEVKKGIQDMKEVSQEFAEALEQARKNADKTIKAAEKPKRGIFAFDTMRQVMDYASVLPGNLRVQSSLYEMKGVYYLHLQKGTASYEKFSRACIQALEFGKLYGADEALLLQLCEHGECLIEEKAIKKLSL